jgi:hypothetical protein
MSNINQNTQTNPSDKKWFEKADYRKVALTRFDDAVALYCAEQYEGSFYMSGYVIEIGAKAKMAELAKTRLSDMTAPIIWRLIDEWVYKKEVLHSKPLTMYEFGEYFYKLAMVLVEKVRGNAPPALHTLLKLSTHYQSLSEGRVYNAASGEPFHAPAKFLKTIGEWAKLLEQPEDWYREFEDIANKFERLEWGTSLRYGESEMNNPDEVARQALSIAYRFLVTSLLSDDELERAKYLALGIRLNLTTASEVDSP